MDRHNPRSYLLTASWPRQASRSSSFIDIKSYQHEMQASNRLLQTLKSGGLALGAWQMLPGANLTRTLARSSKNLCWITIDQEHGNISDDSMHAAVAAAVACGVSPVVRVPDAQEWMIKRALDAGAHGIVIPLLKNAEQAKQIVRYTKFPPLGTRGFGSPFPMASFNNVSQVEYLQQANDSIVVIVQIETESALRDVESIAAVEGIDVLFVGPFDLGNNIGHPILHGKRDEELNTAIQKVKNATSQAGKPCGIYATSGSEAKTFALQGFTMVNCLTDVPVLAQGANNALEEAWTGRKE